MDGFEVIRRRSADRMPATVFLTAYDEFALKAFDAQALDYLVKPVTEARFAATMKRLTRQLRGGAASAREPAIAVTTARGTLLLDLREIDWIEAADNYSRLWVGVRSYLLRESLNSLERRVRARGFIGRTGRRWCAPTRFASSVALRAATWWRYSARVRACPCRDAAGPRLPRRFAARLRDFPLSARASPGFSLYLKSLPKHRVPHAPPVRPRARSPLAAAQSKPASAP